jgi:hypothetical protein
VPGKRKRELVSRNVRKEDATNAKEKFVAIFAKQVVVNSFVANFAREKNETTLHFRTGGFWFTRLGIRIKVISRMFNFLFKRKG